MASTPDRCSGTTSVPASAGPLLEIRDLRTHFDVMDGTIKAVDGVTFTPGPQAGPWVSWVSPVAASP